MKNHTEPESHAEIQRLQARLADLEATIAAIRSGHVDAIVVAGPHGSNIFTLQSPEEPYRILAERMNEGAATLTHDGTILFCNRRLADMVGLPAEALLGSSLIPLLCEDERILFLDSMRLALHENLRTETHLLRNDATLLPVQLSLSSIPLEESGQAICLVATDLSDQKRAEAELRHSKEDWERTFDAVPDMVMLLDPENRILRANHALCSFAGQESDALLGKRCFEVVHNRTSPHPNCPFQRMLLTGVGQQADIAEPRFDKIFDVTTTPVWGKENLRGAVHVIRDITARKRAEAALEISRAQAASSARLSALGMMAGGIAHEINNPLAIVHASASDLTELAESGTVPLNQLQHASTRIKQTANRISKIVKSLRQISRDGSADPFQRASVTEIVEHALELCKERFRAHSVRLDTSIVDARLHVFCREVQIAQVLLNLLQNAFDAVADLDVDRWVRLEVTNSGPSVTFAVIDSGPGVPPELRARIMEPFFTTKPVGKGTGLGLSLSKAIVEDHGGELKLSETGNPTCFSFSLPLSKEPQNAAEECLNSNC
jgi:PAS domain S-box-containing protein